MIRCVDCGRFISYEDLENGSAISEYTPSSCYTNEEIVFVCKECRMIDKTNTEGVSDHAMEIFIYGYSQSKV